MQPVNTPYVRSGLALIVVLILGALAFSAVTSEFTAVTSDGIRRVQLERHPRTLPDLALVDAYGEEHSLTLYGEPSGQVTFVTLVYLRCQSICRTSTSGQSWMQHAIRSLGLENQVRLLTLSFDPANDTPEVMAEYARRMGADPGLWRFATVRDQGDLSTMLQLFGIIVLPDGPGDYSHNAALFQIDETGMLSRAYDVDRPDIALADYLARRKSAM